VHLAYLDDSDTKQKTSKLQVVAGVIVEDKSFKMIEMAMRSIRTQLVPREKIEDFKEFHACELYGGHGVFEGISQGKRFEAIKQLLRLLNIADGIPVVYGAVDIQKEKREIYGSADPLDIAFRICMKEVYEWVRNRSLRFDILKDKEAAVRAWIEELVIMIVDDCEPKHRNMLQSSFRTLRHPLPSPEEVPVGHRLPHFHDDMFFGDSRYSIGIQLADLCSYFIARHLDGDTDIAPFYEMIEPHVVYEQIYPDQADFKTPTPQLKGLANLLALRANETANEKQGIPELQSGNGDNSSRGSEGSEGGDGSGEASERQKAEG